MAAGSSGGGAQHTCRTQQRLPPPRCHPPQQPQSGAPPRTRAPCPPSTPPHSAGLRQRSSCRCRPACRSCVRGKGGEAAARQARGWEGDGQQAAGTAGGAAAALGAWPSRAAARHHCPPPPTALQAQLKGQPAHRHCPSYTSPEEQVCTPRPCRRLPSVSPWAAARAEEARASGRGRRQTGAQAQAAALRRKADGQGGAACPALRAASSHPAAPTHRVRIPVGVLQRLLPHGKVLGRLKASHQGLRPAGSGARRGAGGWRRRRGRRGRRRRCCALSLRRSSQLYVLTEGRLACRHRRPAARLARAAPPAAGARLPCPGPEGALPDPPEVP